MSFTLQVFHAPHARTLDEASAAIDALGRISREDRLRFIRFISALTERFPNDLDDPDATPWPEGLTTEHLDHAVLVFAVNLDRLDSNLMAHVAECAAVSGLHVMDPQNGLFYRSDGEVVRLDGTTGPVPKPRRVIPRAASKPLPRDLTPATCIERLDAELCERLAPAGFEPDSRWGQARRMRGAVEQAAEVNALARENEVALYGSLGLRCRAITGVWLKGLGDEGARLVQQFAAEGWRLPDFRLLLAGLPDPGPETTKLAGFTYATDWSWALAFAERWAAWVEAEGSGHLARMDRPAGIARYLLADDELRLMERRTDLQPCEVLHRIVLAGAYAGRRRDDWLQAFRYYCAGNSGQFEEKGAVQPARDFKATAGRLIAWLDTEEFARQAARLRALDEGP